VVVLRRGLQEKLAGEDGGAFGGFNFEFVCLMSRNVSFIAGLRRFEKLICGGGGEN
jgi:hypothetical protein